MRGFARLELQLALLTRMRDYQPGLVESAIRAAGVTPADQRAAHRRWQAMRRSRRMPPGAAGYQAIPRWPALRASRSVVRVTHRDVMVIPDVSNGDGVDEQRGTPVGRRVVLGGLAVGVLGMATGAPVSQWLRRLGAPALLSGTGWRYYTVTSSFPYRPPASYRLRVTGAVTQPLTLTCDELRALPRTGLTRDFQCVTGWRVPGVRWEGVLLSELLGRAGPLPSATAVQFVSYDGTYTESLTLEQARRSDVVVVDSLDGGPIGREHGGPVRLLVAPMYGYKSCKWLSEVRLTTRLRPGYWEGYGYDQDAWVGRSNGRSDAPT